MSYRLLLPLVLLLALATFIATSSGYPDAGSPQRRPETSALVRRLNTQIETFRSDIEELHLVSPCRLLVDPVDEEPLRVDLLSVRVRPASDRSSGELELYLEDQASGSGWLLLSTPSWPAWTAARSAINQLRARCAQRTRPPVPAARPLPPR